MTSTPVATGPHSTWETPPALRSPGPVVFYDGVCGMCHGAVRQALSRDPDASLRFAPLQGETFRELAATHPALPETAPDSMIVRDGNGHLLMQSDAPLEVMSHLRRPWPAIAQALRMIPKPLRDVAYRLVARNRHQLAATPDDLCPIVPAEHRGRFLP